MRTTRNILVLAAAILGIATVRQASAQSISVIPTVTQADIINATALVNPLTEQINNIAPTSFSLRINNLRGAVVWVDMNITGFVMLDQDGPPPQQIVVANTTKPFPIPVAGRVFTSLDAQPGNSTDIDINSTVNDALKTRLKNMIEDPSSGGKVPSGVYKSEHYFYGRQRGRKRAGARGAGFKQQSAVHRNRNKPDEHHAASAVGQRSRISFPFPAVPMGV